jgi:hypothetical protein
MFWEYNYDRSSILHATSPVLSECVLSQVTSIKFTHYFLLPILDIIQASSREPEVQGRLLSNSKTCQMLVRVLGAMLLTLQPASRPEVLSPVPHLAGPQGCPLHQ